MPVHLSKGTTLIPKSKTANTTPQITTILTKFFINPSYFPAKPNPHFPKIFTLHKKAIPPNFSLYTILPRINKT